MTKEELAARLVEVIRAEAPELGWPDVDTSVLMAAHTIRLSHHSAPPVAVPPEPEPPARLSAADRRHAAAEAKAEAKEEAAETRRHKKENDDVG